MLLATYAYALDGGSVVILEVVVSEDSDDEGKATELTVQQTRFLTDELRKQAILALPKSYTVLSREKIIALAAEIPEDATTVADIGRAMKGDYITKSSLKPLGGLLALTVELYSCESGLLLADYTKMASDLKGLLNIIHENSPDLFEKISPKPVAAAILKPDASSSASIPSNIPPADSKMKTTTLLAIGLDVLGVAALGFGLSQYFAGNNEYDKYKSRDSYKPEREAAYKNAKDAKSLSEISYIAGGVLLASGITIHILF